MAKGKPKDVEMEKIYFKKKPGLWICCAYGNKRIGAHKNIECGSMTGPPSPNFFLL